MGGHYLFNKRLNYTYDIFCCILYCSDYSWVYNIIYGYVRLFDIYSKEHRRIIMAKKIKGGDKINDITLHELLLMMDAKLNHLEDISADNRAIIVKLVKQSNQIVEFLRNLEIDIDAEYGIEAPSSFTNIMGKENMTEEKMLQVKELLEEFKSKSEDLKEFEKELKKHKNKLTPGQIGES